MRMKDEQELRARFNRFVEADRTQRGSIRAFSTCTEMWARRDRGQPPVVNSVGPKAKGHRYSFLGNDLIGGPDHVARQGHQRALPQVQHDNVWKCGGENGERVPNLRITPSSRFPPTRVAPSTHRPTTVNLSGREWADPRFHGVLLAKQHFEFVSSGTHKEHTVPAPPSYKVKRHQPIDVARGRGGNLGGFSKLHAGMMTKSSLMFHRTSVK
jgi:hypothetical protein